MTKPDHIRNAIGVNQPPHSGYEYPLVNPPTELSYLFADILAVNHGEAWELPIRFTLVENLTSRRTDGQTGVVRLQIQDSTDTVVIDTLGAAVNSELFDDRLKIWSWESTSSFLRCVTFLSSTDQVDVGLTQITTPGLINSDCVFKAGPRVTRINVSGLPTNRPIIDLSEGSNVRIQDTTLGAIPGSRRRVRRISISTEPGAGEGKVLNPAGVAVRKINGVGPDLRQNFKLESSSCIRLSRPTNLLSENPRIIQYAGLGVSAENARSMIQLRNSCRPCCECKFFSFTYRGLLRQWNLDQSLSDQAQIAANLYKQAIVRWGQARDQYQDKSLKSLIGNNQFCRGSWVINYCHAETGCIRDVKFRVTFTLEKNGTRFLTSDPLAQVGPIIRESTGQVITPNFYANGQVLEFFIDEVNPQETVRIKGIHQFFCDPEVQVRIHAVVAWGTSLPGLEGFVPGYPAIPYPDGYPENVVWVWLNSLLTDPEGKFQNYSKSATIA